MTIIRVKKDQGYFMASNEPFNDDKLSWEARGVMGYLMSKPDGWEIRLEDLVRKGPAGRSKIERILDELMEAGYVNRIQGRRPDGTYYYESIIYESSLLNPAYNDEELKKRLRKKRAAQARRRRVAYEKKLKQATLSESPSGPATLSESVSGESVSGESPPLVNTEPANTDSVSTKGESAANIKMKPLPAALTEICKIDARLMTENLAKEVRQCTTLLARAGVTPAQIHAFGRWWYAHDWRGKRGEAPKPRQVCEQWGQFEQSGKSNGSGKRGGFTPAELEAIRAREQESARERR